MHESYPLKDKIKVNSPDINWNLIPTKKGKK